MQSGERLAINGREYRLGCLLSTNSGSYGAVWAATDPAGRSVAIKVINTEAMSQADPSLHSHWSAHLEREINFLDNLNPTASRHIVTLIDHGRVDQQPVLVMERLQANLGQWLLQQRRDGGAPPDLVCVLDWARQILDGLDVIHQAGFVYRDLKLSNILVGNDGALLKLADFGSLKREDGDSTRSCIGTPATMAPEQILPVRRSADGCEYAVDYRADYYALGLLLFSLLTEVPTTTSQRRLGELLALYGQEGAGHHRDQLGGLTGDEQELLRRAVELWTVPVRPEQEQGRAGLLTRLVTQLLAFDPADRPASSTAIRAVLDTVCSAQPTPVYPVADEQVLAPHRPRQRGFQPNNVLNFLVGSPRLYRAASVVGILGLVGALTWGATTVLYPLLHQTPTDVANTAAPAPLSPAPLAAPPLQAPALAEQTAVGSTADPQSSTTDSSNLSASPPTTEAGSAPITASPAPPTADTVVPPPAEIASNIPPVVETPASPPAKAATEASGETAADVTAEAATETSGETTAKATAEAATEAKSGETADVLAQPTPSPQSDKTPEPTTGPTAQTSDAAQPAAELTVTPETAMGPTAQTPDTAQPAAEPTAQPAASAPDSGTVATTPAATAPNASSPIEQPISPPLPAVVATPQRPLTPAVSQPSGATKPRRTQDPVASKSAKAKSSAQNSVTTPAPSRPVPAAPAIVKSVPKSLPPPKTAERPVPLVKRVPVPPPSATKPEKPVAVTAKPAVRRNASSAVPATVPKAENPVAVTSKPAVRRNNNPPAVSVPTMPAAPKAEPVTATVKPTARRTNSTASTIAAPTKPPAKATPTSAPSTRIVRATPPAVALEPIKLISPSKAPARTAPPNRPPIELIGRADVEAPLPPPAPPRIELISRSRRTVQPTQQPVNTMPRRPRSFISTASPPPRPSDPLTTLQDNAGRAANDLRRGAENLTSWVNRTTLSVGSGIRQGLTNANRAVTGWTGDCSVANGCQPMRRIERRDRWSRPNQSMPPRSPRYVP